MMKSPTTFLALFLTSLVAQIISLGSAFAPMNVPATTTAFSTKYFTRHYMSETGKDVSDTNSSSNKNSSNNTSSSSTITPFKAFPTISKIAGIEWTGSCRYVNADLVHLSNLKLSGGVKYEIDGTKLTLTSFLTFPSGATRQVVMQGERKETTSNSVNAPIDMYSVEEGGPIMMKISEIAPDTILIHEVEIASGKTIMTSSVNIVQGMKGLELVGVSHEVGDDIQKAIEGHQIWRMTGGPIQFNDFDYRDATGW